MKKIFLLTAFVSISMLGMDKPKVYITEVVNNTDEPIYLEISTCPRSGESAQVTKHISLKTGEEKIHLKAPERRTGGLSFRPRTRNFIDGLDLPVVSPKSSSSRDIAYYTRMNFRLPYSCNDQPEPFLGLRLLGDLLQFRKGTFGVKTIGFNDEPEIVTESLNKVRSGSNLTVEIKQLTPTIYHRHVSPALPCRLAKNTLDIAVNENDLSTDDVAIRLTGALPKAYVAEFKADHGLAGPIANTTIIKVKFDDLEEASYLNKFYEFMESKELVKKMATSSIPSGGPDATIIFIFYSDISIVDFKSLLDEANKAKLHLK